MDHIGRSMDDLYDNWRGRGTAMLTPGRQERWVAGMRLARVGTDRRLLLDARLRVNRFSRLEPRRGLDHRPRLKALVRAQHWPRQIRAVSRIA